MGQIQVWFDVMTASNKHALKHIARCDEESLTHIAQDTFRGCGACTENNIMY